MRRFLVLLLLPTGLSALLLLLPPAEAAAPPVGTLEGEVLAPYVQVGSAKQKVIGAGVAIRVAGHIRILTAAHVADVVTDDTDLLLVKADEDKPLHWRAKKHRVGSTDKLDLALLELWRSKHLVLARFDPKLRVRAGEDCWYVGTPFGLHQSLEKSIINRPLAKLEDGIEYTLFNGNGTYGNSGGPLFVRRNSHFYLAGIVVRGVHDIHDNPRTPIGAVPVGQIATFFSREKAK